MLVGVKYQQDTITMELVCVLAGMCLGVPVAPLTSVEGCACACACACVRALQVLTSPVLLDQTSQAYEPLRRNLTPTHTTSHIILILRVQPKEVETPFWPFGCRTHTHTHTTQRELQINADYYLPCPCSNYICVFLVLGSIETLLQP